MYSMRLELHIGSARVAFPLSFSPLPLLATLPCLIPLWEYPAKRYDV